MSTNPWATSRVPDGIEWYCSMLWYPVWLKLPFNYCKSPTLQSAKASETITESPPCLDTGGYNSFTKFSSTYTLLFRLKTSKFNSSVQRNLFHCSIIQFCAPWPTRDFWHCFTSVLEHSASFTQASFTQSSLHSRCWHINFTTLFQMFGTAILQSRELVAD